MEGNLFHLIKTRKRRPLAGGLVSSIFRQLVSGLDHIHSSGYFHRDMKPENVLVTTTGLFDYTTLSPVAPPNAPKEKDVVCIIKLADFGLARETKSRPPYTEYVSTRWYRAPEVLLLSKEYSNPVDMWALGTMMAELVNLQPLFPGANQLDQITKICRVLGNPSDAYGLDSHQGPLGGGAWPRGIKLAGEVGYRFPETQPKDIHDFFDRTVPLSLVHCIRDLLRYDPARRLTSRQCMEHQYLMETTPRNNIPFPQGIRLAPLPGVASPLTAPIPLPRLALPNGSSPPQSLASMSPRSIPPSHSHGVPSHRPGAYSPDNTQHFGNGKDHRAYRREANDSDVMDVSPREEPSQATPGNKLFGSFKRPKWGFLGGNHTQALPRVEEGSPAARPPKRPQSSSSDEMSIRDYSPDRGPPNPKKNKKEAEKLQKEAEMQKRRLAQETQREQARAVMQKRNRVNASSLVPDFSSPLPEDMRHQRHTASSAGPRRDRSRGRDLPISRSGQFSSHQHPPHLDAMDTNEWRGISERALKARRLEWDEDSASSDVHSVGRASAISFASVDSDPGPSRVRNRPNLFGLPRMQSTSSLRTSVDEFPPSARSSNSFSMEGQLANDFRLRATMEPHSSPLSRDPPLHSPSLSPPISPLPPPWIPGQQNGNERLPARREAAPAPPYASIDPGFEFNSKLHAHQPDANFIVKPAINPIFKVPYFGDELPSPASLPSFSELEAVAGGEYPPGSPT